MTRTETILLNATETHSMTRAKVYRTKSGRLDDGDPADLAQRTEAAELRNPKI